MSRAQPKSDGLDGPGPEFPELSHRAFVSLSAAAVAVGLLALVWATSGGLGTHHDSGIYLGTAENIANGRGITVPFGGVEYGQPLSHYPPLYPLVLSIGPQLGLSTLTWAKAVNLFAFAVACGAILLAFHAMLRRQPMALICCIGAIVVSPIVVERFAYALSEGLFLALGSVWAILLFRSVKDGQPWALGVSGLIAVLASLTPFHGLALLAAGSLWIALRWPSGLRQRWALSIGYGAAGVTPLLLWVLSRRVDGGSGTNREVGWRPFGLDAWEELLATAVEWAMPARFPYGLGLVVTASLVGFAAVQHQRRLRAERSFLLILAASYLLFTAGSRLLLDPAIPFDSRLLLPIYPIAAAFLAIGLTWPDADRDPPRIAPPALRFLVVALGLGVAGLMSIRLVSWAAQNNADGLQYSAPEWQESALARSLRSLPSDVEVFSIRPGRVSDQ